MKSYKKINLLNIYTFIIKKHVTDTSEGIIIQ